MSTGSRCNRCTSPCRGWLALLWFVGAECLAQGVAPSQVTPPTLRLPPSERIQEPTRASPGAMRVPDGAGALYFIAGDISLEGAFDEMSAATAEFSRELSGRRISVADLYAAAGELERTYAVAGYPLARMSIPPQHLADHGPVRIVVIDGFIESFDDAAVPVRMRRRVAAHVRDLIGRRHLRQHDIERALLLAGTQPGLSLRSSLVRGEQLGGTRLVLDGTDEWMSTTVAADNRMSPTLGGKNLSTKLALNGAFGVGEQLYLSAQMAPGDSGVFGWSAPLRTEGGGVVLGLGSSGLVLNPEYTVTRTRPQAVAGVPLTIGRFQRLALRADFPLIRTRSETLSLTGELSHLQERTDYVDFDTGLRRDRLMVLRAGLEWTPPTAGRHSTWVAAHLAQGLGGRTQTDAASSQVPLSRIGARPVFTRLNADLQQSWVWTPRLQGLLVVHGQSTFDRAVLQSQQFQLDGADASSAFLPGTFSVDEGVTLRAELQSRFMPAVAQLVGGLSPYVFTAVGRGYIDRPTALEPAAITSGSFGMGLRGSLRLRQGGPEATFSLEGARQQSNATYINDGYRLNAALAVRF